MGNRDKAMTINWSEARVLVFDTCFTDFKKQESDVDRLISDMKEAHVNCLRKRRASVGSKVDVLQQPRVSFPFGEDNR